MSAPEGDVNVAEDFAAVTGRQPQAIRTALAVLRAVAEARGGITAGQLCAALRLPPATAYRIVAVLVREEYLIRLPDGRGFGLGARAAELAAVVAAAGCACGRCAADQQDSQLYAAARPAASPAGRGRGRLPTRLGSRRGPDCRTGGADAGLTAARTGADAGRPPGVPRPTARAASGS
jgi:hypothetical protein